MTNRVSFTVEAVDRASAVVGRIEQRLQSFSNRLSQLVASAGVALSLGLMARGFQQAADVMTLAENRIRLVTKSTEEFVTVQRRLFELSQETRTEFASTVDLYGRVARSTDALGVSQEEVLELTELVNKTIQISGATAQESAAGVMQFGQALAAGALRGDELRSVMEQMPRLALAIVDGLEKIGVGSNLTIGDLRRLGQEGKLSADLIIRALQSQAASIREEFEQVRPTIESALTRIGNSLTRFIANLGQASGATEWLTDFLMSLAESIDTFSAAVSGSLDPSQELTDTMKQIAVTAVVAGSAIRSMVDALRIIPGFAKDIGQIAGGLGASVGVAGTAFESGISPQERLNRLRLAGGVIAEVWRDGFDDAQSATTDFFEGVAQTAESASERISQILLKSFRALDDNKADLTKKSAGITKVVEDLSRANQLATRLAAIEFEAETFGKSAAEIELYRLSLLGASEAQLEMAQGALNLINMLEREKTIAEHIAQLEFKAETLGMDGAELELYRLRLMGATDAQLEMARGFLNLIQITEDAEREAEAWASRVEASADEAARSIQRAFADFFFDPFEEGLRGLLKSFVDTIRRMVAEIMAHGVIRRLFGSKESLGTKIFDLFSRASGGPVAPFQSVQVHDGEIATFGDRGGYVTSRAAQRAFGGGSGVTFQTNIDARGADPSLISRLPKIMEERDRALLLKVKRLMDTGSIVV